MKRLMKAMAAIMLVMSVLFAAGCIKEVDPNNGGGNNGGGNNGGGNTVEGIAPSVTTASVTDITANSAKCGGEVTSAGDSNVTDRGLCWNTNHGPTIYGDHVNCGSGMGAFVGNMMGLSENTVYYVRSYATNAAGTSYGEERTFQTGGGGGPAPVLYTIEVLANPNGFGEVYGGGEYQQGVQCTVMATAHEGYLFLNWTENGTPVSSDESYVFTVTGNRSLTANFNRIYASHDYVDLGLPSGTLWATCNVGADKPEDNGDYFAWGETVPKTTYNWITYGYCNGSENQLTKYCNNSSFGYGGFTDPLVVLQPGDDAATANWGDDWCMPTANQWRELYQNTTSVWTSVNRVYGRLFTADNGNTLFLPAAGSVWGEEIYYEGDFGYYWSNSLGTDYPSQAWDFLFYEDDYYMDYDRRSSGRTVRAVRSTH